MLPLWGHAAIVSAQRRLAWVFGAAFVMMTVLVAPQLHVGSLTAGGGWVPITLAIALVASGGGLSWANTGSDYSRYLPQGSSQRAVFWWSSLGGLVPAVLLEVLGAAIASITKDAADPISGIPTVLPGWVAVPYLLVATLTLLAVNTVNLYSSGLTLQSLGLRLPRWQCVVLDSVICAVLCFLVVFAGAFNTAYSEFLGVLIIWLAPWIAIYAVDALLRRNRYDAAALLDVTPLGRVRIEAWTFDGSSAVQRPSNVHECHACLPELSTGGHRRRCRTGTVGGCVPLTDRRRSCAGAPSPVATSSTSSRATSSPGAPTGG